jgi:hypothetical protein
MADPAFLAEVDFYRREFIGGPTPLYFAKRLTEKVGGARICFEYYLFLTTASSLLLLRWAGPTSGSSARSWRTR